MSALEEAAAAGKCTQDSRPLSVGDATRTLTLPHLPYADAVHAALLDAAMPPAAFEAGLRLGRTGARELFLRAVWPAGSPLLDDRVRPHGLTVAWSHVTGWSAHTNAEDRLIFNVDVLVAPAAIAYAALRLAEHGLTRQRHPPDWAARWSQACDLDIALSHFDDREDLL